MKSITNSGLARVLVMSIILVSFVTMPISAHAQYDYSSDGGYDGGYDYSSDGGSNYDYSSDSGSPSYYDYSSNSGSPMYDYSSDSGTGYGYDYSADGGAPTYDYSADGGTGYDYSSDSGTPMYDYSSDSGVGGNLYTQDSAGNLWTQDSAGNLYTQDSAGNLWTQDSAGNLYTQSGTTCYTCNTSSGTGYSSSPIGYSTTATRTATAPIGYSTTATRVPTTGSGYSTSATRTATPGYGYGYSTGYTSTPTYRTTTTQPAIAYPIQTVSTPTYTYQCPTGYSGTYPNCVAPVTYTCPTGTTGTYPNCVAPTYACPSGTTGTYPNCYYIQQQTGNTTPIIINNNNTNTNYSPNTNTNTNSAPVTAIASLPVQRTIAYATQPISYNNPVSCTITASPSVIQNGQATTLAWSSNGATTAFLNDGIGTLTPNGTLVARPSGTVNYILTVYGQGTSATCNVLVTVSGSSISLSQIPYTGFDFGPVGDAIYWGALVSFALAAAYLLVYYRGGAMTLATAMITGRSGNQFKPVKFTDKELDSVKITENAVKPAAAAPVASFNLPVAEVRRATTDSMIVNHSKNGEAPRIVITRM